MNSSDIGAFASLLLQRDDFLILTHRRPDGDTIGSAAALCRILRQKGKSAFVFNNTDATARYTAFLQGLLADEGYAPKTLVTVDIADESLFTLDAEGFKGGIDFAIDHHPSNEGYAKETLLLPKASATGEIIFSLACQMGARLQKEAMEAIYLAVATDTGCFLFSNTTAFAHEIGAAAIKTGADFHSINVEFFRKRTKKRHMAEKILFQNMIFSRDGKIAGSYIPLDYIEENAITEDDMENLANLLITIEGIVGGVLATELKGGGTKISLRSYEPLNASKLAQAFGGGGHARAAGCNVAQRGESARDTLMAAAIAALEEETHV